MSADVIEQLRMLRDVLDAHAAPVTLDDLHPTGAQNDLVLESVNVIDPDSLVYPSPRPRWTTQILIAAAIVVVVVGLVIVGIQDHTATGPGSGEGVSPTLGSPDRSAQPSFDDSLPVDVPAGSTLRFTKELPGGAVSVYDTTDRRQVCLAVSFDNGGSSGGCTDSVDISRGAILNFMQHSQSTSQPALLVGLTAIDIGFKATVNGTVVEPDSDGIWYALVPLDVTDFTITTNRGSRVVPLTQPETTPTSAITTTTIALN
jgi:hypothetical protein